MDYLTKHTIYLLIANGFTNISLLSMIHDQDNKAIKASGMTVGQVRALTSCVKDLKQAAAGSSPTKEPRPQQTGGENTDLSH